MSQHGIAQHGIEQHSILAVSLCILIAGRWSGTHCHCCTSRGYRAVSISPGHMPGPACLRHRLNSTSTATAAAPHSSPPQQPWLYPCCPHGPLHCLCPLHSISCRSAQPDISTGEAPCLHTYTYVHIHTGTRLWCSADGAPPAAHVPAHVDSSTCRCTCTPPLSHPTLTAPQLLGSTHLTLMAAHNNIVIRPLQ